MKAPCKIICLPVSILSIASKRKTQIGGMALHILRGGMFAPHGKGQGRLAFKPPMG
jgi:hypothetical protein